ncbi:MAG: methionine synthase [Phycisphaeraceae bacterium]|nr:methionine synthase [Phycisphaeraceae bacterium]
MSRFSQELNNRVLVFDGAMGTSIHRLDLSVEKDYQGRENCTEILVRTRPELIQAIHESFLAVGSDAVETDTFGANPLVLAEFDLADQTYALNKTAAEVARAACAKFATHDKPRFVVGSMGPGTKLITLGQTDWDTMLASYRAQVRGLIDGGVDALLIETAQDLLQVKCAISACLAALEDKGKSVAQIPIMAQVTIETTGSMLLGTEIGAAAVALAGYPILSLGINCATGPVEMTEHVRWLGQNWPRHISVQPNAGLPVLFQGQTQFPLGPQPFAEKLAGFVSDNGVRIVGGCCGTTPDHIAALVSQLAKNKTTPPRSGIVLKPASTSLYSAVEHRQETSILNVGERTNASGSKKFRQLLEAEQWDEMISLAREQLREGSHVIDVNVDYAGRDGAKDMAELVHRLVRQVNAPLMLDSTQPATLEAGLRQAGGKCLVNSANLENGEEKFARMCALVKRYHAALVLGTIDEDPQEAMARTEERKIAIAHRMFKLATQTHGLAPEDLFFDPLVLPISTGMEKDRRSALETIAGVRRIRQELPLCQTIVGLSNVSFGLKPAARQVLNSVFLHELITAGLTSAILHVTKILPQSKIPQDQWDAALDLIYNRPRQVTLRDGSVTEDPLQRFIDLFPDDQSEQETKGSIDALPLEERLRRHIIDGEKKHLIETLEEARQKYPPLAIINDHLLDGMKVVGELFGSGRMQLPFVLQSAEVMKMAVAHLEPYLDKVAGQSKGSIVLATVKGDVHDIGKNLVDIILSNNGYTVHNLGIKQPIADIIQKWQQTGADAIGLSGLLVKSVNVMEENLGELNARGITAPVLLGGAALSRHYAEGHLRSIYQGKVYYGQDAFEGLRIMEHLASKKSAHLDQEIEARLHKRAAAEKTAQATASKRSASQAAEPSAPPPAAPLEQVPVPQPPFWGERVIESVPLEEIYPYINTVALFRGQWQFKKGRLTDAEYEQELREKIQPLFERLQRQCRDENILRPKVVYGYFPAGSQGNDLIVFDPVDQDKEIERFSFPRQPTGKRQCISDFFRPLSANTRDVLGLSCVTMGSRVSEITHELFAANKYQEYLYLHGMGVEAAEGLAELWHKRMRQELGIDSGDSPDVRGLFTQGYRGSRYSFGYPACPEMSDQEKLFRLLRPERIGCVLTENWQIDPEQSTSALVVHHPAAKYFNV